MIAFIFPGQGSQHVGMGADLVARYPVAAQTIEQADELLGFELSGLMFDGPADELTATEVAQPALLAHSVATLRVLEAHGLRPDIVAGHSLGEYSALVAAEALDFPSALRLVRRRGELMAEDGKRIGGMMAAIIGLDPHRVEEVVAEAAGKEETVVVANYNCPGQLVISGTVAGVKRAAALAKEAGARGSIPLKVSGAFHSALMATTAQRLGEYLAAAAISDARVPLVSNADAVARTDAPGMTEALGRQIDHSVLWQSSVQTMIEMGADTILEGGPKQVLTKRMARIDRSVTALDTGDVDSLAAEIAHLS